MRRGGGQCTYKRNVEALSRKRFCCGKAISIIYSACVFVALGIQHAKPMRLLYFHVCPVWLYDSFPYYPTRCKNFVKNFIENKMCVLIYSTNFV